MKAIDTTVLLFAEQRTHRHHLRAKALLEELATGATPWAIPWPCVYEFLRLVTHPRVFHPPMPLATARRDLDVILASPSLVLLGETERHADVLRALLKATPASGNHLQLAHVAALCREHGVAEILSADLDLLRFQGLRVVNPFDGA